MKVVQGLRPQSGRGRVLTLGVFDGVHLGHARILRTVFAQARRLRLPAAVITFEDHPRSTLNPGQRPPRLAPLRQCLARMKNLGMDEVYVVRFTQQLANTSAEDFVREYLCQRLRVKYVVVGEDFVFGHNGRGNGARLQAWGRKYGFGVAIVKPMQRRGKIISSSGLRQLVAAGQFPEANQILGWRYVLHGRVVKGDGRGMGLGLPTANLRTTHEIIPAAGTYAVLVTLGSKPRLALCHIGRRPTFRVQGPLTIEIHVPGWQGNLRGRWLGVEFLARLGSEQRFSNGAALLRQVRKDWQRAKRIWTKLRPRTTIRRFH